MRRGHTARRAREASVRKARRKREAKSDAQQKVESAIDEADRLYDGIGQMEGHANDALMAIRKAGNRKAQQFAQKAAQQMNQAGKNLSGADRFLRSAWEALQEG